MERETLLRLGISVALLSIFALWELRTPRRRLTTRKSIRWMSNLCLAALNAVAIPLLMPLLALGMAVLAMERGWGLFNRYEWPPALEFILAIIVLDFVIYLQHILFHAVPVLWRLHRVHHSDTDFDVTTALRFHVVEIAISMGIKIGAVLILGVPVFAVLVFEILLNGTALFNHANIRLPLALDRMLRAFLVTPDMHRVHHSIIRRETDCNFGFNLSIWDRLCGTYRAQPEAGHEAMTIGLGAFREEREQYLDRLLTQPFRAPSIDTEVEAKEGNAPIKFNKVKIVFGLLVVAALAIPLVYFSGSTDVESSVDSQIPSIETEAGYIETDI